MTIKQAIELGAKAFRFTENGDPDMDHITVHDKVEGQPRKITVVYKDGSHITLNVGPLLKHEDQVEILE